MSFFKENLARLRVLMKENSIDAYIIPSTDPHLGEYIPDHWRIIDWLTGFTGSAATVLITDSFAGFWTDYRYYIQVEKQLCDSGFAHMKPDFTGKNDFLDWMADNIQPGSKIALDGRIFSIERIRKIENALEVKNISMYLNCDLVSE